MRNLILKFVIHLFTNEKSGIIIKQTYQKSDRSISMGMCFTNIDVNEKVNLFNKTIKIIMRNYILYEAITCDDRDPL